MSILSLLYLFAISILGIFTAFLLPINLRKFLKILIGPAIGIILTTTLTLIISLIFGFNIVSIVICLIIYLIGLIILRATTSKREEESRSFNNIGSRLTEFARTIKKTLQLSIINYKLSIIFLWPLILILLTIGIYVIHILFTQMLAPNSYGLATGGGGLYGDTAMHTAYTMSLVEQGFPPQNPLFAGRQLIYPFLVNFFSAILIKLGMNLRFAFILPQIAYFLGFASLFYSVCRKFTSNLGTLFTMLIFFLGWGLGFTVFLQDISQTHVLDITREYTNNLANFNMHNVLTGLIFPERSFLPGLVIGLLITLLVIARSPDSSRGRQNKDKTKNNELLTTNCELRTVNYELIIIGALLGLLPLWHTHTFIFFGICIGFWLLFNNFNNYYCHSGASPPKDAAIESRSYRTTRSRMTNCFKELLFVFGIAFLIALPQLIWFKSSIDHQSFLKFSLGWFDKQNQIIFWLKNTGLLIPLAILGIITLSFPKIRILAFARMTKSLPSFLSFPRRRESAFFFLPIFLIFIIANLILFSPWNWDNIKIFTWVFLFLSIPVGHMLSLWFTAAYRNLPIGLIGLICLIGITVSLTFSGTLSLVHQAKSTFTIYSNEDIEMSQWIKTNTLSTDIFMIDPWPNQPIALTGRNVYLGYPGHLWVHGIDYGKREALVKRVLAGEVGALNESETKIDYLVVETQFKNRFINHPKLKEVFGNSKFIIYQII